MNFNIFNIKIKLKNNFDVFRCIHATEIRVYSCNKRVRILKKFKKNYFVVTLGVFLRL